MSPLVDSQQWASYITLAEAKAWLQFPSNAGTGQDALLEDVIAMSCEMIQNEINRPVAPTQFTEYRDGWSGEYIMLYQYPVLEFISVVEFQSVGGPLSLEESTPGNAVDGYQAQYDTGKITRVVQGYSWPKPWFPGQRNIEITYVAGYNPLPPVLRLATRELIKYIWINTQQASREIVRNADYDPGSSNSGLWAGIPNRIVGWIAPYRRVVFG